MDQYFYSRIDRAIAADQQVRAEIKQKLVQAKSARRLSSGASIFISNTLTIEPVLWCESARRNVGKMTDGGNNRISVARVRFGEEVCP